MPIPKGRLAVVCFAVAVTALMLGASWAQLRPGPGDEYQEYRQYRDGIIVPYDEIWPTDTGPSEVKPTGTTSEPVEPLAETSKVVGLPTLTEIRRLAELEESHNFTNILPSSYNIRTDAVYAMGAEDTDGTKGGSEPREVEEADVIKLVGDVLYVLNPYRGLMVFDLSDPDSPKLLGRAPVLGDPVDMYVFGQMAYIIVSASYGYWYRWSLTFVTLGDVSVPSSLQGSVEPNYYIGTQVLVVDLEDLRAPTIVTKLGIQGFATDSRRVGEVLYFVSAYHSWYYYNGGDQGTDLTFVMSLDMADTSSVRLVDKVSFPGAANVINVTEDAIFVAETSHDYVQTEGRYTYETTITYVDISDPRGSILVRGACKVTGRVFDKYQINYFEGTLRVVSHYDDGALGSSELWVLDVSDPDDVAVLGTLPIDDAGTLMATRFAGTRAYTIHLPRSIDPLDVIDLSDPSHPKLCDVLEMPGWVTHIEVRGYKLIALGVDDSEGRRVAVSLFDVENAYKAVLMERVQIGEGYSWSGANFDPKALTVLDEQGLVVVPYGTSKETEDGYWETMYGVQLVKFDLTEDRLALAGSFEQPDSVVRTRGLGDRIMATSTMYLQVADVSDPYSPRVTATVELCPRVLDVKALGTYGASIVQGIKNLWSVHVSPLTDLDSVTPVAHLELGEAVSGWLWRGETLHVASWSVQKEQIYWHVLTADFSNPTAPRVMSVLSIATGQAGSDHYRYYMTRGWGWGWDWGWELGMELHYYYGYGYSGPSLVAVGDTTLALFNRYQPDIVRVIDLSNPHLPHQASVVTTDQAAVLDVRAHGDTLFVTDFCKATEAGSTPHPDHHHYPAQGWYRLHRFDLSNPNAPLALPVLNIPGVPADIADGGEVVYTLSTWWDGDAMVQTRTLNVVRLDLEVATLIAAIEVPPSASIQVVQGIAYMTEGVSRSVQYVAPDGQSRHYHMYNTTLRVIALRPSGSPTELATYTLQGYSYKTMVRGGTVVLASTGSYDVVVMRTRDGTSLEVLGLYELNTLIYSFEALGDRIYLAQGVYGTSVLATGR